MFVQTRTARVELTPAGIVIVRIFPDVKQSVADAKENIEAAVKLGGRLCPLLTDIQKALPLEADTRHFYSGKQLTEYFSALAILVSASPLGVMMGNVYIRVARPGIPFKLFNSERSALAWLEKVER